MGRFIVAAGVNPPDANIKVDILDPMISDSTLLLMDFAHPADPTVGVPASGSSLKNLAAPQAAAALSITETQAKPVLTIGSTFSANGLLERTTNGGLHFARSTKTGDSNTVADISPTTEFVNALIANSAHSYFFSFWGHPTRAYGASHSTGNVLHVAFGASAFPTARFYTKRTTGTTMLPSDSRRIGYREQGHNNLATTLAPLLQNIGVSSAATSYSSSNRYLFSSVNASAGNEPSMVVYRVFLEDLTLSGRSYATLDALDYALFTERVLTEGGDLYGDSWTNPSTLDA